MEQSKIPVRGMKVGIIGCGNIFPAYVKGCRAFDILDVTTCADIDHDRAEARAAEFSLRALRVDELLDAPDVDIVVNLTVPSAHAEVSLAAIAAGKHVHSEKPLAVTREAGRRVVEAGKAAGVLVGCAPDTFLGGGLQTCRKLIDDGAIGEPVAATAFMLGHGPEAWHPNPDFFYQTGAGPMFDMGPYYLTALVSLLGPVRRVTASARISFPERIATSQARYGQRIQVEVPTHVACVLDFTAGPVATLITSFDVWSHNLPRIEIYGSEGSLSVPDPNTFGGPVKVRRAEDPRQPAPGGVGQGGAGADGWTEVPLTHSAEVGRGIGVADLAYAASKIPASPPLAGWARGGQSGRPNRASGDLAFHVLDLMHAFVEASDSNRHIEILSQAARPAALPVGLPPGQLDP